MKHHIGKTPHTLTDSDWEELGRLTNDFSGSDIATLCKDAIMAPVRRCQSATHFKVVNGYYTPCPAGDAGAVKMTMYEIPDTTKLLAPKVELGDFMLALTKVKPSVDFKMI